MLRGPILALLIAAFSLLASSRAAAQSQVALESVVAMLMGVEDGPSQAEWRALGPQVISVLASIASSAQQPGFVRLRAIQAAGAFATPAARTMLRRALRSADPLIAREAALSMQRAFGSGALRDIAPLLAHRDTAVREAAIHALGAMDDEAARSRLRARLPRETDEALRGEIERALAMVTTGGERVGSR